jgi:hypothetical protein
VIRDLLSVGLVVAGVAHLPFLRASGVCVRMYLCEIVRFWGQLQDRGCCTGDCNRQEEAPRGNHGVLSTTGYIGASDRASGLVQSSSRKSSGAAGYLSQQLLRPRPLPGLELPLRSRVRWRGLFGQQPCRRHPDCAHSNGWALQFDKEKFWSEGSPAFLLLAAH